MIKRIYVDNFRCLVNFEMPLGSMNFFLGGNGTGKSSTFDVLWRLKAFLVGDYNVAALFRSSDLTRWEGRRLQRFELDIEGNGGVYSYILSVEHAEDKQRARVEKETLLFDGQPLFRFSGGEASLFRDNFSAGPTFPADWSRSGVAPLAPRPDNTLLTWFKEQMRRLVVVRMVPSAMSAESPEEATSPDVSMSNYASWLRYLSQEHQGKVFKLTQALEHPLEGFGSFRLARAGESHRVLKTIFSDDGGLRQSAEYRFDELSDGQRALVALYTLLHCSVVDGATVCVDEPDNFLALPEIQPWLLSLHDMCAQASGQALLISHHPELINVLASDFGWWFSREAQGPVRVVKVTEDKESGLPISELVARGWLHGS